MSFTQFVKAFAVRFINDSVSTRAASLTYTTLLSLVPLVIFIFYILSFFPALQTAGLQIEHFILNNFIASSANVITEHLQSFVKKMQTTSWINITALAIISVLLIFNIVLSVDAVWHVPFQKDFGFKFLLNVVMLFVAPIVFAFLLLLSSFLMSLPMLDHIAHLLPTQKIPTILPFLIEWFAFSFFHWVIPSCRVYFRFAIIVGLLTTILFEIAKWGFVEYLRYFPTYQIVYGALATIPIFLLWIYVSWLIMISMALICHLLQTRMSH